MTDNSESKSTIDAKLKLESCVRPLICSHIRLDGDAVGSELGLYHILSAQGKSPHIVNSAEVPRSYRFLQGADEIGTSSGDIDSGYDLVVVLDCPHFGRLDDLPDKWPDGVERVNIDHHATNENYLDINWVNPASSSVGEMLFALAKSAGWRIPTEAATAFYLALLTDTNRFTLPHTTVDSLRNAAEMVASGAAHVEVAENIFYNDPIGLIRLKGIVLNSIRLAVNGRVAVGDLTQEMFNQTGVEAIDTQEFAEYPRSVEGVEVGILLREMGDGRIKVSLRSRDHIDVEKVAEIFDGGGHPQAAGCVIEGDIAEVERKVLREIREMLNGGGADEE